MQALLPARPRGRSCPSTPPPLRQPYALLLAAQYRTVVIDLRHSRHSPTARPYYVAFARADPLRFGVVAADGTVLSWTLNPRTIGAPPTLPTFTSPFLTPSSYSPSLQPFPI